MIDLPEILTATSPENLNIHEVNPEEIDILLRENSIMKNLILIERLTVKVIRIMKEILVIEIETIMEDDEIPSEKKNGITFLRTLKSRKKYQKVKNMD